MPCDQVDDRFDADRAILGAMVVGRCLHFNHTWHHERWWHDPDRFRSELLPHTFCPQRNLHYLLPNEPCGLCVYNVLGSWQQTERCGSK